MQQVKLFKGMENDMASLEQEVNAWIRQSGARVISLTGNIAPQSNADNSKSGSLGSSAFAASDIILIVFYETAEQER